MRRPAWKAGSEPVRCGAGLGTLGRQISFLLFGIVSVKTDGLSVDNRLVFRAVIVGRASLKQKGRTLPLLFSERVQRLSPHKRF